MAYLGLGFSFTWLFSFAYWEVPWWIIVAVAAIVLLVGVVRAGREAKDFSGFALPVPVGVFLYGMFDAAGGSGEWEPLDRPNWILILFITVHLVTLVASRRKKTSTADVIAGMQAAHETRLREQRMEHERFLAEMDEIPDEGKS